MTTKGADARDPAILGPLLNRPRRYAEPPGGLTPAEVRLQARFVELWVAPFLALWLAPCLALFLALFLGFDRLSGPVCRRGTQWPVPFTCRAFTRLLVRKKP
jgi:hypothetical protein